MNHHHHSHLVQFCFHHYKGFDFMSTIQEAAAKWQELQDDLIAKQTAQDAVTAAQAALSAIQTECITRSTAAQSTLDNANMTLSGAASELAQDLTDFDNIIKNLAGIVP